MNLFAFILWILSTAGLVLLKAIGVVSFSWWWVALPTAIYLLVMLVRNGSGDYLDGVMDGLFISSLFDDWDD